MKLEVLDPWEYAKYGYQPFIGCIYHTETIIYVVQGSALTLLTRGPMIDVGPCLMSWGGGCALVVGGPGRCKMEDDDGG